MLGDTLERPEERQALGPVSGARMRGSGNQGWVLLLLLRSEGVNLGTDGTVWKSVWITLGMGATGILWVEAGTPLNILKYTGRFLVKE